MSPDLLDALVWAVAQLAVDAMPLRVISMPTSQKTHTDHLGAGYLRDLLRRQRPPSDK